MSKYKYKVGDRIIVPIVETTKNKSIQWGNLSSRPVVETRQFLIIGRENSGNENLYVFLIDPNSGLSSWTVTPSQSRIYGISPQYLDQQGYYSEERFIIGPFPKKRKICRCIKILQKTL